MQKLYSQVALFVVCVTALVAATHIPVAGNLQSTEANDKALSVITIPPRQSRLLSEHLARISADIAVVLTQRSLSYLLVCRSNNGQILVTLLDGQLVSLDHDTGVVSWTLDLGLPLVSGSGVWQEQLHTAQDPLSRTILPGADGSLYILTDAAGVQQTFEV